MASQDLADCLNRRLKADRQAQRFMCIILSVMDRLPGKTGPQKPAIAFHHADTAGDIVQKLVATAESLGRYGRAVILQADPARNDDRGGQDQFERAESVILRPIIIMQEGPPFEIFLDRKSVV